MAVYQSPWGVILFIRRQNGIMVKNTLNSSKDQACPERKENF